MLARLLALFRRAKPKPVVPTMIGNLEFRVRSADDFPGWIPPAERRAAWLKANPGWIDGDLPIRRHDPRDTSVNLLDF